MKKDIIFRKKNRHLNSGMTILELIVAALIMAMVAAGMGRLFFASKRLILHARARMQSATLARRFVEPLSMQVDQSSWGTNCVGSGACAGVNQWIDGINYNVNYAVTSVGGGTTPLRRVVTTITWNEAP